MKSFSNWITLLFVGIAIAHAQQLADMETTSDMMKLKDRCTSIAVGKKAMADGSTVTTHTNDCHECDFRITHVPARDWPAGSMRPVHDIRVAYPRYIESNSIHGDDYHPDSIDRSIYNWTAREPYFFIPQVPHTYAYTLGSYAIQNEKQVSIGESTCGAVFASKPAYAINGSAVLHMETLTELALERCASARCAVQVMGSLSEQYGFYGTDWDGAQALDEAGEALTVSDGDEAWVFHVLPDDTGKSAIWIAQRVPEDHITVVANQFTVGVVNLQDEANFLGSKNMFAIAERHSLWSAASGKPFNFAQIFGINRHDTGYMCSRRIWRVMTLAAPSLLPLLSPYTDGFMTFGYGVDHSEPYPFSIKPDTPLAVTDIMRMNRDQFENTEFDMSKGLESGLFGDTMRYSPMSKLRDPVNGITTQEYLHTGLGFQRPISLWRTAYATVTQSRKSLPDLVGALTWIAPYAPHFSSFVPIYANAQETPKSMKTGNHYKFDKHSNWWIHCLVGNYAGKFYKYTIEDIVTLQQKLEITLLTQTQELESRIVSLLHSASITTKDTPTVSQVASFSVTELIVEVTKFQEKASRTVLQEWWDFFFVLVGKYRDMFIIIDEHAEIFTKAIKSMPVTRNWLESVGYWGPPGTASPGRTPMPVQPINIPTMDSAEAYAVKYPTGMNYTYALTNPYTTDNTDHTKEVVDTVPSAPVTVNNLRQAVNHHWTTDKMHFFLTIVVGVVLGMLLTISFQRCFGNRSSEYVRIN